MTGLFSTRHAPSLYQCVWTYLREVAGEDEGMIEAVLERTQSRRCTGVPNVSPATTTIGHPRCDGMFCELYSVAVDTIRSKKYYISDTINEEFVNIRENRVNGSSLRSAHKKLAKRKVSYVSSFAAAISIKSLTTSSIRVSSPRISRVASRSVFSSNR
jgi:hypothetical protein